MIRIKEIKEHWNKKRLRICKVEWGYIIKEKCLFWRVPYVRATPDWWYILYKTYEDCLKELWKYEKKNKEEVIKELFI